MPVPRRYIEVSHEIEEGMETYPGLPAPRSKCCSTTRRRDLATTTRRSSSLRRCTCAATRAPTSIRRGTGSAGRPDLAQLPLASLAHLPVVVIDARGARGRGIGPESLAGLTVAGCAVLFRTGWSGHWRTERYFDPNPFLKAETCRALIARGARFAGIDSLNIDDVLDLARPAHTLLLGAGIPVCEHMTNLAEVPATGGYLHAVPIAWAGGATFPVRAYVLEF